MLVIFEENRNIGGSTFSKKDLQSTRSHFKKALDVLERTEYLAYGDNQLLVAGIRTEVEQQVEDPEERLGFTWATMVKNIN